MQNEYRAATQPYVPGLDYFRSKFKEAIELHQNHPTEDNLLAVADFGRLALNSLQPLATAFGSTSRPYERIYNEAADYCRDKWYGRKAPEPKALPSHRVELLIDKVDELQRTLLERLPRKRAPKTARKEVA